MEVSASFVVVEPDASPAEVENFRVLACLGGCLAAMLLCT